MTTVNEQELTDWLIDYFKREYFRLTGTQFARFTELRGFSKAEQEFLTDLYLAKLITRNNFERIPHRMKEKK